MALFDHERQRTIFRWIVFALVIAALATFAPLWVPLVLAVWIATLTRPLLAKLAKVTRGRRRAAGALVVLLVMLMVLPLALIVVSLVSGALDLGEKVAQSADAKQALIALAAGGENKDGEEKILSALKSPQEIIKLVQEYGSQALQIAKGVAGAASKIFVGIFIFVYAVYVFLVDGPSIYEWLEKHSPISEEHTRRFTAAFHETGRGLFVGIGLTGLAQGAIATITYLILGVPRALVLGLLTCVVSLIPSVGTALVWVPVAIGLLLAGKTVSAIVMAVVGVAVIGTIDNILKPVFLRFGKLELSTFVLLTSIVGGVLAFGPGGLLLGPLLARLAKEALLLARADRPAAAVAMDPSQSPPSTL